MVLGTAGCICTGCLKTILMGGKLVFSYAKSFILMPKLLRYSGFGFWKRGRLGLGWVEDSGAESDSEVEAIASWVIEGGLKDMVLDWAPVGEQSGLQATALQLTSFISSIDDTLGTASGSVPWPALTRFDGIIDPELLEV